MSKRKNTKENMKKLAKNPARIKKMTIRSKAAVWLSVLLLLTLAFGYLGVNGAWLDARGLYKLLPWIPTASQDINKWPKTIALGLDLRGGVYVEYQAEHPENTDIDFNYLLEGTMSVIANRLTAKGYPESNVVKLGTDGIRVEIPDVTDPNAVLNLIGSPAKLEFRYPDGTVFMEGKDVRYAVADNRSASASALPEPVIAFQLTPEGAEVFAKATEENIGNKLSIYLGDELLMEPTVETKISGGEGIITGMGTLERARDIAIQIQSGALPLVIQQQKVDTISATLGVDALSTSVAAALIGLLLVMLLMIIRYRLPGLLASWALTLYLMLLFFFIAIVPGIQLTLPGIAGIILGIGMAVDANVVIFERAKEELIAGRSTKAAVRASFKAAMTAIIDSNVTTLIAAAVLAIFGTGSIQGFATTLFLSVITSLFSALVITRFLLHKTVDLGAVREDLFISRKLIGKEAR